MKFHAKRQRKNKQKDCLALHDSTIKRIAGCPGVLFGGVGLQGCSTFISPNYRALVCNLSDSPFSRCLYLFLNLLLFVVCVHRHIYLHQMHMSVYLFIVCLISTRYDWEQQISMTKLFDQAYS